MTTFHTLLFFFTYRHGNRSIESQAETNFKRYISETAKSLESQHLSSLALPRRRTSHIKSRSSSPPLLPLPLSAYFHSSETYNFTDEQQLGVDLEGLIQSGYVPLKVKGLRKDFNDTSSTLDLRLKADATSDEIMVAIKDAGAILPIFSLHV